MPIQIQVHKYWILNQSKVKKLWLFNESIFGFFFLLFFSFFHSWYSDDAELDENDEDYNGDKQIGSESIVIKFETNEKTDYNLNAPKPIVSSNVNSNDNNILVSSAPNTHENHTLKEITNIANIDDETTNNNKSPKALDHNNKRIKAYEQRNLYVTNNGLSDGIAGDSSSSIKSYIHIEVYKGNLDDLATAKPKDTISSSQTTTAKSIQQHSNSTHAISTTKISSTAKSYVY